MIAARDARVWLSVACRDEGVNPTSDDEDLALQDIRDDYVRLRGLLALAFDQFYPHDHASSVHAIAGTLDQLRDQLALHFTLQLRFGYFTDTLEVAPRLVRRADELRREQFLLFLEACEIADCAQTLVHVEGQSRGRLLERLRGRFDTFSTRLKHHDGRERDLIYEALCDDIGVGD